MKIDDMTIDAYHAHPAWSKSALDLVNRSMSHFLESKRMPKEPTPAMNFGAAFHCRVLTPHIFSSLYCVAPGVDRRTKAGKEEYETFILGNSGKKILAIDDALSIEAMAESVLSHPVASSMLVDGEAEQSFFWTDKRTGLQCKNRTDYIRYDGDIIDLKKTTDASYWAFQKSIVKYRYHVQGAFYLDGCSKEYGKQLKNFILIAVEDSPPYAIQIYRLDDDAIKVGRIAYEGNLDRVAEYEKDKSAWSGYPIEIVDMSLPSWCE